MNFQQASTQSSQRLDPFFVQTFEVPAVTISYINRTYFYMAKVFPKKVLDTSHAYEWDYKGSVIKNNEDTFACYCEYKFTTSQAMGFEKYFHPATYVVEAKA